jgi:hypothetical protein
MEETEDIPLDNMLTPCYVIYKDLIFNLDLWAALRVEYFKFNVFAGASAMSLGMESATGSMKTTHAIKISPSAAQIFRYALQE